MPGAAAMAGERVRPPRRRGHHAGSALAWARRQRAAHYPPVPSPWQNSGPSRLLQTDCQRQQGQPCAPLQTLASRLASPPRRRQPLRR
eukprot:246884-Chlamydomonas_euryale.AAC.1